MSIAEPTTIEERYGRATRSSHLEVIEHTRCDADYLIAAAWACAVHDGDDATEEDKARSRNRRLYRLMASLITRLMSEFDAARGDIDKAKRYTSQYREAAARELTATLWEGKTRHHGPTRELHFLQMAEQEESYVVNSTRAFALMGLKSLNRTRDVLHRWAEIEATRRAFMVTDEDVARVVGRVLDIAIDSHCYRCAGTGKVGPYGTVRKTCPTCHGEGNRRRSSNGLGQTQETVEFGRYLLAEIDKIKEGSAAKMRAVLR